MSDKSQEQVAEQHEQSLYTIPQFCRVEPAFTEGGVRWTIFQQGAELEASGALVRVRRRVLLSRRKFLDHLCSRKAAA